MADYRRITLLKYLFFVAFLLFLCTGAVSCSPSVEPSPESSPEPSKKTQRFFSGTNQEITVYTIHGENPGPTLLVFAGIHGDEGVCPLVATKYSHIKLKKGNLILEKFAERVAQKTNVKIKDVKFHFQVNNTNTGSKSTAHKQQRKSLTYYAVTKEHKVAIALEATKNCTPAQTDNFLTIALNAVIEEIGIVADNLPSDSHPSPGKKPRKS